MKRYGWKRELAAVLVAVVWVVTHFAGRFWDLHFRQWAFSDDSRALLLPGKWKGSFIDPDGVKKEMALEIFPPPTAAEVWLSKESSRYRPNFSLMRELKGKGTVLSKLGKEAYRVEGMVDEDDDHLFRLSFMPVGGKYSIDRDFYVSLVEKGNWKNNQMQLTLIFNYYIDGGTRWDSADPRFDQHPILTLTRQKE
ncbi:hypothetical protein [Runella sp.]|uniref:hypothetical protein n=1 Tax=Runella sp. TaxID=1960881 RepID=UPI003D10851A